MCKTGIKFYYFTDWSAKKELNLTNRSKSPGSSVDSQCSQRFSHKQTLLRRAFQEMLKSELSPSAAEQPKESEDLSDTEMKKAEVSKCQEKETIGLISDPLSSESASPAENIRSSCKSNCPDSSASYPLSQSSESADTFSLSSSRESITPSVRSDKESDGPGHDDVKLSSPVTEKEEVPKNFIFKVNLNDSDQTKTNENYHDSKEVKDSDSETSQKNDSESNTQNVKSSADSRDIQANIIDSIVSPSGVISVKVLRDEIIPKADDKDNEDQEVQPKLLLSVLYKELMKTRQEVEKLRKVQELMLTEKGEKKEDVSEQSTDKKPESNKTDENANRSERMSQKRKEKDESHDTEVKEDEFHHESKKSKISIRSDLLPEENGMVSDTTSSDTSASQKNIPPPQQVSSPTLVSPTVIESASEVPVITLESSAIHEASHPLRVSPVISAASSISSSIISGPPKVPSASPKSRAGASPGMCSPGVSRTSPGAPRTSPALPRASPGVPLSNISPGIPISPGLSGSPGLQKSNPSIPRSSPGVLRMSPGLVRASSGILRASPGTPVVSPVPSVLGSVKNGTDVITVTLGASQVIPASTFSNVLNPLTNSLASDNLQVSHSTVSYVEPKMTTAQSGTAPVTSSPEFPQTPITSNAVSVLSPPGVRVSPHMSKADTATSKADASLANMSPTKLRSVFGISSSEVELMPIQAAGAKYPPHEAQNQTFLKAVEDSHNQVSDAPLLMNAVRGIHRENSSKEAESSDHGPMIFRGLSCPEDPRMTLLTHQYESGVKRHAFSTSDLPDHPVSVCKQPPPLKPASALHRRHSDNLDIHSAMHHQAMYLATHKNLTNPLHPSTSATEHNNGNSVHPLNQTSCPPPQHHMSVPSRRRNSDSNSSERSQEYQQSVPMGMQHRYPHLPPGAPVMRSLGPDKASIFPIPPALPPSIRSFRPTTPPSVNRPQREHFPNENFYRSNLSFFERIREKCANSRDNGVSGMDRLQPSTASTEKPIQPQTFAPRVLVRESVAEASSHIPTTTFSTMPFPNPNQPMPNVLANHQNHFSGNIHPGSSLHPMAPARIHPNASWSH